MTITNCELCGVKQENGTFYWSHTKLDGTQTVASSDEVYSKVCAVAKQCGKDTSKCLNKTGTFKVEKGWVDFEDLNQLIIKNSL